jgi:hypothetical protein
MSLPFWEMATTSKLFLNVLAFYGWTSVTASFDSYSYRPKIVVLTVSIRH